MAEIDADSLLPNDHVKQAVSAGEITQLSRGATNRYAHEGDTFSLDGETFEIVAAAERTLGELTDEDARREGSEDLESYRERMIAVHGGDFEWDEESEIISYRFEQR
ncbi:MAG: ASCH domain-containing protein [Euryarchaeota archaeon]|nr:ASCH domain-containing protein [Euryarchaeota archaeon]